MKNATTQGFHDVKAYRLPPPFSQYPQQVRHKPHLYRHRLGDDSIDVAIDPPSIMLYIDLAQFKRKPGEEGEMEEGDDAEDPMDADDPLRMSALKIVR